MSALLAFDTATEHMVVALASGEQTWVHESEEGAPASSRLLPTILALLQRGGIGLADLDAIAFGRGPGAFTGLRAAASVAQGLALGASKPVIAVDTLEVVAEDARRGADFMPLWVTIDARMDQIYAANYRYAEGRWRLLDGPVLTDVDTLNETWLEHPPTHVAGNALTAFAGRLKTGLARCHPEAAPRGAALLRVATTFWLQNAAVDAADALPRYIRDKVALTIVEREFVRTAAAR
jgi:tRNA threonylcarbamoyladenosine biosynthesis protein TsaB